MSGINSNGVYLPSPVQSKTVGAIATAPIGTTAPSDAKTALASPWESGGYIGEDGIEIGLAYSTTPIRDWSKSVVRTALSSFDGTAKIPIMQIDEWGAKRIAGDENVTVTAATSSASGMIKMGLGAHLPDPLAWCASMKDGDKRVRVYMPDAQVTAIDNVAFKPDAANQWVVTLSCSADESGNSIYIIYDDGTVVSG